MTRNMSSLGGLMLAALLATPVCAQTAAPPIGSGFPGNKPIDLAGIRLGMSAAQAKPVIAAHYARQVGKGGFTLVRSAVSKEPFVRYAFGFDVGAGVPSDRLSVYFSGPASGNQAVFVRRDIVFDPAQRPNTAATIAALKEKFGEPSMVNDPQTLMRWSFRDGRRLTKEDGDPFTVCNAGTNRVGEIGNMGQTGQLTSEEDLSRLVSDALRTMSSHKARCDIHVFANYGVPGDIVNGRYLENPNVIDRLIVYMVDYTRLLATNAQDATAADAQFEKDRQAQPTGGAAPRL